ncbi:MAG: PspC domain-containing protein [Muribaculaceae bacterium]|nr:PspC domain-containing protein [Muribaculaceae bacterium]
MKKTININLAGYPFTIDEDAYNLLKDYLDTIRYAFDTKYETEDIAQDIESRIAELLIENEAGGVRIVSLSEISHVIDRIGKPSDFIEIDDSISSEEKEEIKEDIHIEEKITPPPYNPNPDSRNSFIRRSLFRDPQNAMLGGVCSGLGYYFHLDPTLVRLLTVLLFFLSASTVAIVYIILWIVVPEARTPLQRMKMMGENPTVENIGKSVTENYQENHTDNELSYTKSSFLSNVFSVFVKCILILCFIIALPVLLALLLVLVACIIAFFAAGGVVLGGGIFDDALNFSQPGGGLVAFYLLLAALGAIITIGIPVWLLFRKAFKKDNSYVNTNNRRSLLIIWCIGIALTAVFTVKTVKAVKKFDFEKINQRLEQIENINIENGDIEGIQINEEGIKLKGKKNNNVIINKSGIIIETEQQTDTIVSANNVSDSLAISRYNKEVITESKESVEDTTVVLP